MLTKRVGENIDTHLDILRNLARSNHQRELLVAQWNFLSSIGLDEFYGCDINIIPLIEQIPPNSDIVDVKSYLQHRLVEILLQKIESDESTILLDTRKMKDTPAEVLIPLIEELRKKEMANTPLHVRGRVYLYYDVFMREIERELIPSEDQSVNLERLWLTAYGYQVLSRSSTGLFTDLKGLKKIERALNKLHIPLKLEASSKKQDDEGPRISDAMRDFILSQAKSGHSFQYITSHNE